MLHYTRAVAAAATALALVMAPAALAEPGYTTIFDGTATGSDASFDKWSHAGGGGIALQPDGTLRTSSGFGMHWYTVRQFGDMSLKVDYRDARSDPGYSNGGVLVRFPDPTTPAAETPASWSYDWPGASGPFPPAKHYQSDPDAADLGLATGCQRALPSLLPADWLPAWIPVTCGEEIQINDSPDGGDLDPRKTGSVYGFADLDAQRSGAVTRYPNRGAWHTLEVRTVAQQYTVLVDGTPINQWDGAVPMSFPSRGLGDPPTMARQFASGYVGLQNHGDGDVIEYRDVRVKELTAPPRNTVAPAVTGDGLTGRPLSCTPGTWSGVDADQAYTIDWLRSNAPANDAPTDAELGSVKVATGATYTPTGADLGKVVWCRVTATNAEGGTAWATKAAPAITLAADTSVSGTVPATLSLALGAAPSFGAFAAGVERDYAASTTANVSSTAGDATLSVSSAGRLANGAFALASPLQVRAGGAPFAAFPATLASYAAPVSNDTVAIDFAQHISAGEALRTGSYAAALTFTLATTTP